MFMLVYIFLPDQSVIFDMPHKIHWFIGETLTTYTTYSKTYTPK